MSLWGAWLESPRLHPPVRCVVNNSGRLELLPEGRGGGPSAKKFIRPGGNGAFGQRETAAYLVITSRPSPSTAGRRTRDGAPR